MHLAGVMVMGSNGTFSLMVFRGNCARGRTGHMVNVNYAISICKQFVLRDIWLVSSTGQTCPEGRSTNRTQVHNYTSDTSIMEIPRGLTDCITNKEKTVDTAVWLAQLVERRTVVWEVKGLSPRPDQLQEENVLPL